MTRRVPELDGLRGIAAIVVVLYHSAPEGLFRGGFVGVDIFFVLSAFVISSSLDERPGLARFYWNRACRLMPALWALLIIYLVIAPVVWPTVNAPFDVLLAALYLTDYTFPIASVPLHLGHTWSLAIEEQFYLIWPFAFRCLQRTRRPLSILSAIFFVLTAWRLAWPFPQNYYRLDTHATGLILGAILFFWRPNFSSVASYVAVGTLTMILLVGNVFHPQLLITLAELCAAVLISTPPRWLARFKWLGDRSYAIYLWHFPITLALTPHFGFVATASITLTLSVVLASISYVTVEALGRRLRYVPQQTVNKTARRERLGGGVKRISGLLGEPHASSSSNRKR